MTCTSCPHDAHEGHCIDGCPCGVTTARQHIESYPGTLTGLDVRLTALEKQGHRIEREVAGGEKLARDNHAILQRIEANLTGLVLRHEEEIKALKRRQEELGDAIVTERTERIRLAKRVTHLEQPIPRGDPPEGQGEAA